VIRKHCLGNFREFLEAVATSASMGYYLDNASSRASPANENYARELFELHTLGAEHYFNDLYNRWKDVPGAKEGAAVAYIDQDVYEAARAFSGWTVGDGSDDYKGGHFPKTGQFYYFDGWHDNYQKRVLGAEIEPNQGPMADGRKVLDLVAYHPGTAEHICAKLCRRLVGDHPPPAVVSTAIQVWKDHAKKPFQIRETVRAIISSKEFTQSLSTKLKNPFELVCSILRVTKAEVTPSPNLWSTLHGTGYKLFEYGPPTGHPDREDYWLGTGSLLAKWNLLIFLFQDWMESAKFNLGAQQATARSSAQIVEFWCKRMLGRKPARPIFDGLVDFLRQARGPNFPPGGDQEDLAARLNALVALIALTPDFQYR